MNYILMEIFPESVANSIYKVCIHQVAELYILEEQKDVERTVKTVKFI
jgi:hypothetical protein